MLSVNLVLAHDLEVELSMATFRRGFHRTQCMQRTQETTQLRQRMQHPKRKDRGVAFGGNPA